MGLTSFGHVHTTKIVRMRDGMYIAIVMEYLTNLFQSCQPNSRVHRGVYDKNRTVDQIPSPPFYYLIMIGHGNW